MDKTQITIEAVVAAPIARVWECYNKPEHITQWNFAIDTWHCPWAENDLRVGGSLKARMEAKDKSFGFDFGGVYDIVEPLKKIAYTMSDGRRVETTFTDMGNTTRVVTIFDAESENSAEMQKNGWQAILDNFKKYTEAN